MQRPTLTVIDPVKPIAQTYASPVLMAAQSLFDAKFLIRPPVEDLGGILANSDAVWVDWCVEHAIELSLLNKNRVKPLFIRMHAFEVLDSQFSRDICWSNVSALILVNEDLLAVLNKQAPQARSLTHIEIIPNGIDTALYEPSTSYNPFNLAWVGVFSPKKNPFLAIHVLDEVRKRSGLYHLFMAGEESNERCVRHIRHLTERLGLSEHVTFCGHVSNMAAWYEDKGVLLSTSLYESFGLAIGEAASAGLTPVIFDFPDADQIWPSEAIVKTISEACDAIQEARPSAFRSYVCENYPLRLQITRIEALLRLYCGAL